MKFNWLKKTAANVSRKQVFLLAIIFRHVAKDKKKSENWRDGNNQLFCIKKQEEIKDL